MTSKQPSDPNKKLVKADPTTIRGKFLVGYRGWFTCPGDGPPLVQGTEWAHWNDDQGQFNAELIPDPEYYSASDLAVMPHSRHQVFSSRNVNVIRRHLNIMAMHGIDGLFITRRGTEIAAAYQPGGNGIGIMKLRSEGINNIFRAAEQEGRVVGIMYDLAGMPSHQIEQWTAGDWDFMVGQKHVLDSPAYVHEHGAPVVALWSVGFKHAGQDPEMIMRLLGRIREISGSAYIILGVPVTWQKQDANWQAVYQTADALAPMSIGTLVDEEGVNNWSRDVQQPAIQSFKSAQRKTDYVSVVWPGNEEQLVNNMGMSTGPAPRQDGAFLWRQVYNAHRDGARLIYAEMFDGFDDGTAILPSLGAQGDNTPSDWYLRICGYASEALKGEKRLYEELPRKELAEYWSVRPHYAENQEDGSSSGPAGGSGSSQPQGGASGPALAVPQRAPTRSMTAEVADAPPPYSLEASAPVSTPSAGAVFTAEPESAPSPPPTNPAPGPQPQYQNPPVAPGNDRPRPPRVDSTHSTGSASSYPGQHRPEPIAVPTTGHHQMGIPVQTPASYHSTSPGYTPSGYPGASPGPHTPSTGHASPPMHGGPLPMHNRPPQHPAVAGRPPPTNAPRPPSRPGRPTSAASGSSNPHSSPPPMPYGPGGNVHQLTNQMQGMNVGDRPAPEHVFAGIGQTRPQMAGTPASPFEGTNIPGRFGQQQQDGPGLFGPPQPPRHQNSYGSGYESPQTPPTGIPGNPLYPGPLQHGHGHHAPTHQGTIGPGHPPPGPVHQGTIGPGQHHPAHQATLGPSSPHPGQPPQPAFQQHQPYVPHHQPTSPYTPPQGPSGPAYFGPGPGGPPPQPNAPVGAYSPHSGGPSPQPPQPHAPGGWPAASPGGSPYSLPIAGGFAPPAAGGSHGYPSQPGQPPQPGQPGQPSQPLVPGGQPQGPYAGFGAGPQPPPVHPLRPPIPGGQYFDSAMGAVGRYAGEDKKKKLEQGMASAFTAGTKLWGKFNK